MKLVNPHPVKKPIQLKWCTKKKPEPQLQSYGAPPPAYSAPSSYLPARQLQQPALSSPCSVAIWPKFWPQYTKVAALNYQWPEKSAAAFFPDF
jgi:hypothetical protein